MTELVKSASQSLNIFCVAPRSYVFNLLLFQLCFKFNSVQSADKAIEGNKQTEKAAWGWGRQTVSEQSYTRHMSIHGQVGPRTPLSGFPSLGIPALIKVTVY